MHKTIGIFLLSFWIPLAIAMAFPVDSDGWYTIAGLIMVVFGTWGGVLLVNSKN